MKVYIELYFLNNYAINFFVNYLSISFLTRKCSFKLFVATFIASLYSVLIIYFDINTLIYKIAASFIVVLILNFKEDKRSYIKLYITFITVTAILGGISYMISYSFNDDLYQINYGYRMLTVYLVAIIFLLILNYLKYCFNVNKRNMRFMYDIEITCNGVKMKVNAYLDSGNFLTYKLKPVIVLNKKIYSRLYSNSDKHNINEYIDVSTIHNVSKMPLIVLDKLKIINLNCEYENVYATISTSNMKYDVLLNSNLL